MYKFFGFLNIALVVVVTSPYWVRKLNQWFFHSKGPGYNKLMKVLRLLENMTGGTALVESMHGAGSPQSQRVMYQRLGKLPEKMRMAKKLAGVGE